MQCNEDIETEDSEEDIDEDDTVLADLKTLFTDCVDSEDAIVSPSTKDLPENGSFLHSEDSPEKAEPSEEEYFSPTDANNHPSSSVVNDIERYTKTSEGKRIHCEEEQLEEISECFQCSLRSLESVLVKSEPIKLQTKAVQCEPILLVSQGTQCEIKLKVNQEVQCQPVLKVSQSIQCDIPCRFLLSKELQSISTCTSTMSKDTQPKSCVESVGVNCDLISVTERQQCNPNNVCFITKPHIELPPLQKKVDFTEVVSSSQTSGYICDSSCGTPENCEVEIMSESSDKHSSHSSCKKSCEKDNESCQCKLHVNSPSSSVHVSALDEKDNEKNGYKRNIRTLDVADKTADVSNLLDKSDNVSSDCTCSSEELLREMGVPSKPSPNDGKNEKIDDSGNQESREIVERPISSPGRHKCSSAQARISKDMSSPVFVPTKGMEIPFISSMACERYSSPESLDEDTCEELLSSSTRGVLFLKVQSTNTNPLTDNNGPKRKFQDSSPSLVNVENESKISSYSNNKCNGEHQTSKRKKILRKSDVSSSCKPIMQRRVNIVPYSDSEESSGSESSRSDNSVSSDSMITVSTLRRKTKVHNSSKYIHRKLVNTKHKSECEKAMSPAKSAGSGQNSTCISSHTGIKHSTPVRKQLQDKEVLSTDSDSDFYFVARSGASRSSCSKQSTKSTRSLYQKWEREAIVHFIIEHKFFDRVKGKQIWEIMEKENICPNRTWQSMKEHFIKRILPKIETFHLQPDIAKKFIRTR